MAERFSDTVREFFLARNYLLTKRTKISEVNSFIKKLQPQYPQDRLIRLGADYDGGYLVPDDLDGIEHCFSPGVSDEASFEAALLERKITSYLCDYSVDGPPKMLSDCTFDKKFLGCKNDDIFHTLESWMGKYQRHQGDQDMLLQMDIEGYEYPVLLSTPQSILKKFRIMVIEFHDLFDLFNPTAFRMIDQAFDKLLENFHVAHIHPNMYGKSIKVDGHEYPRIIEMTLIRKDRFSGNSGEKIFPHPLDQSCVPNGEDLVLPKFWYQ